MPAAQTPQQQQPMDATPVDGTVTQQPVRLTPDLRLKGKQNVS